MSINPNQQLVELQRMKRLATALLGFFALVFIISSLYVEQAIWIGFVQATAEAAMVGAIADWFAVTALFRHPLGLKIPHTAIVPTRKDTIGRVLGQFVKENFLVGPVIRDKLGSMQPARHLAGWLSQPANAALIANYVGVGLAAAVQVMKDEDVQDLIQQSVTNQIRTIKVAPLLGNVLSLVLAGNRQRDLAHGAINLAAQLLEDNQETLKEKIAEETPWWLPKNVDKAIYQKVIEAGDKTFREIKGNPNHAFHQKFSDLITNLIEDLKSSPEVLAKEEAIKEDLLNDPIVKEFSATLWGDLKNLLLDYSQNPQADSRQPIEHGLIRFAQALLNDEAMLRKMDGWIEEGAVYLVGQYGYEAEQLIAHTISRWDGEETSRKIELHVGRDLQFIRINGTLVGGLVGFIIHTISLML
jgi:uncharacterized membrane-anchored protein YjiN (DUF445 family)